jgi:iron-sulfur cluster repair protein YtfE (RIC family)
MSSARDLDIAAATLPTTAFNALGKLPSDAILMLEQDHREVGSCFAAYQELTDAATKQRLWNKICMLLKAHMMVEEQIFYPRAQTATGGSKVDHAVEEHSKARRLIDQIEAGSTERDIDALMQHLRRAIEEHVAEEEAEFFPTVREIDLQWFELGAAMAVRRTQLLWQLKAGAW